MGRGKMKREGGEDESTIIFEEIFKMLLVFTALFK